MSNFNPQCTQRLVQSTLNDGLIIETDSTIALHIPNCWLHATFTKEGGFLGGITLVVAESIRLVSDWMLVELADDDNDPSGTLRIYTNALKEALHSRKQNVVQATIDRLAKLQSWLESLKFKKRIVSTQVKMFAEIWDYFLKINQQDWSCCESYLSSGNLHTHFKTKHISFLEGQLGTRGTGISERTGGKRKRKA